jgi:hypothetical protein|tara:strand:- start:280 stop:762 length:483 start_codon:yes stop_codon:yes gene_type:complete
MEKRWSYQDAIAFAKQERKDHPVPWVEINQNADETLDFGEVNSASNKELEAYLAIYGGNKAILEQVVASHQMKLGAMQAQFEEGYNVAFAQVMKDAIGKKPTRDEARGIIMNTNKGLADLFKKMTEMEAAKTYEEGRLRLYTQCWNTVSRIVALRTKGID